MTMITADTTSIRPQRLTSQGFTIVELLVGSVLVLIAAAGAALIVANTSRTLQAGRDVDRQQALVDDDVAAVREIAARFTCCSGACGVATAGCFPGATPGDDRFYYPFLATANAAAPAFLEGAAGSCNVNGGVGNAFIAAIAANAPTSGEFNTQGLVRAVAPVDANDPRNHRVRLTYTGPANRGVARIVEILPPAASWCP